MGAGGIWPTLAWLFFGLSGRVSRQVYLLAWLLVVIAEAFLLYRFTLEVEGSTAATSWALLFVGCGGFAIWSTIALSVKRLHDFGQPGIFAVCMLIPMLSVIVFIALCIVRGTPGPNRFGSATNAPQPRTPPPAQD